jgi:succinoglycan biosynthesis protein ExoM
VSESWSTSNEVPGTREISVCIATHLRPDGLERLLTSLVDQRDAPPFEVIVVDNDAARSGERIAAQFLDRLALTYLVEPVRGIARTRNRAVAAASTRFLAFIDDDEWAAPQWLAAHAKMANASGADAVVGPVKCVFADQVPHYIQALFNTPLQRDGAVVRWYDCGAGNSFVRRDALPDSRAPFSTRFDLTGGEDIHLWKQMTDGGARLIAALDAVVFEYRPRDRANLRWLVRRWVRNGVTMAELQWGRSDWKTTLRRTLKAGANAMHEVTRISSALWNQDHLSATRHLVLACMEIGKILHVMGIRIEEYRKHP